MKLLVSYYHNLINPRFMPKRIKGVWVAKKGGRMWVGIGVGILNSTCPAGQTGSTARYALDGYSKFKHSAFSIQHSAFKIIKY